MAWRLRSIVLIELPAWQLLVLAAAAGTIWAASLFDWSFVTGRHAFWQFPKGTIKGSGNDMGGVLVGYLYYIQDSWHLPLFYVSSLGTPTGTNVIFMDIVPIVALAGKLTRSLTGATLNPYGAYLFLCFALPGVMMTLVLIAAKIRYALAVIISSIFADTLPSLLERWGHIPLESHFLLIGALALYLFSFRIGNRLGFTGAWIGYLTLTYLTNVYLFVMVGTVWLCAVVQRRLDRLTTTREALGTGSLTVAAVMTVIVLSGQFGAGGGLPFGVGYGVFSMNLLSPFVPQNSGLLPGLGSVIDATGGQYEGFNYLGLGLLLASLLVLPDEAAWLARNLRRHVILFAAFAVLMAFAISYRVFAGQRLLFELPLPHLVVLTLGIFRSSGRFFWLIAYAQVALMVVLGFRRGRPVIALCLAGAAILQLLDIQPLREQIIASIVAARDAEEFDPHQVTRLIARARHVQVVPSIQCSSFNDKDRLRANMELLRANMELMLAAARANVPTNTVLLSRQSYGLSLRDALRSPFSTGKMARAQATYCEQEVEQARRGGRPGDVLVLLSGQPQQQELAPDITCAPLSWARYCESKE